MFGRYYMKVIDRAVALQVQVPVNVDDVNSSSIY